MELHIYFFALPPKLFEPDASQKRSLSSLIRTRDNQQGFSPAFKELSTGFFLSLNTRLTS